MNMDELQNIPPPPMPNFQIPPGGTRWGMIYSLAPHRMLPDWEEINTLIRQGNAPTVYTWNEFMAEVNFISFPAAVNKLVDLHNRDVRLEANGGYLDGLNTDEFMPGLGMSMEEYFVTWYRIGNRYAWLDRLIESGEIPDPEIDPMPPVEMPNMATQQKVEKERIKPYIDRLKRSGERGIMRLFAQAILYVFGYIAEKPGGISDGLWEEAVTGLFKPPYPLTWMMRHPGAYFDFLGVDEHGGSNGFFPTPVNIALLMGQMLNVRNEEASPSREGLLEAANDPCVGTGNMIWGIMNTKLFGEFTDISPSLVLASRAICAMYAPWFANQVFCANSLQSPDMTAIAVLEQGEAYTLECVRALKGFYQYALQQEPSIEHDVRAKMVQAQALSRQMSAQIKTREMFDAVMEILNASDLETETTSSGRSKKGDREAEIRAALGRAQEQESLMRQALNFPLPGMNKASGPQTSDISEIKQERVEIS